MASIPHVIAEDGLLEVVTVEDRAGGQGLGDELPS